MSPNQSSPLTTPETRHTMATPSASTSQPSTLDPSRPRPSTLANDVSTHDSTSPAAAGPSTLTDPDPQLPSPTSDRYGFRLERTDSSQSVDPKVDLAVVRRRESKWLTMLDSWETTMRRDFNTVRSRCRKGIPRSVRGRAWTYLTGAQYLKTRQPQAYADLLKQEGNELYLADIRKDLHRQFPTHEMFGAAGGHGQRDLYNVLKAYSILNPEVGYCQAMAPIAAILLMHMPSEDAFWCLTVICDKYLKNYYTEGMETLQLDGMILEALLKKVSPQGYKHLSKLKVEPVLYMTEWFLCCFTRTLPWASVLRVWDIFLCEGVKVLFKVGLVILKYALGTKEALKANTLYDTLLAIRAPPAFCTEEDFLIEQILKLDIHENTLRKTHFKQLVVFKKMKQNKNN